MTAIGLCCRGIVSLQELAQRGMFFQVIPCLRVERLHLVELIRRQLWEMANDVDQLPTVLVLRWVTLSPGRHRSEANAMVNDPENLTIRHRLSTGQSEVRRFRVDILPDRRLAAAVVGMAGRAVVGEVRDPLLQ